jgi:Flp pilus assembly protein TadB
MPMIFFSLILNTAIFFIVLNFSYIKKKRENPAYPDKPVSQLILFPLALGVVFTLIVDVFRGFMLYQLLIFLLAALLLYWIFYVLKKS